MDQIVSWDKPKMQVGETPIWPNEGQRFLANLLPGDLEFKDKPTPLTGVTIEYRASEGRYNAKGEKYGVDQYFSVKLPSENAGWEYKIFRLERGDSNQPKFRDVTNNKNAQSGKIEVGGGGFAILVKNGDESRVFASELPGFADGSGAISLVTEGADSFLLRANKMGSNLTK